jgi:uncharacterized protein YdaU (DUF1376 family)
MGNRNQISYQKGGPMKPGKTFSNYAWWMKFEPHLWVSNPTIQMMSDREYRTYFQLLNFLWLDDSCTLPDDPMKLGQLAGVYPKCLEANGRVMSQFVRDNGRLYHRELWEERRESAAKSSSNAENGRKGGRANSERVKKRKENERLSESEANPKREPSEIKASNNNNNIHIDNQNESIECVDPIRDRDRDPDPDPAQSPPSARHGSGSGPDPVNTGQRSGDIEPIASILKRV